MNEDTMHTEVDRMELDLQAPSHTLLEVWSGVLDEIEKVQDDKFPIQQAVQLVQRYPEVSFRHVPEYVRSFSDKLREARDILRAEIESDAKCFEHVEDDAEANRSHYLNILLQWQLMVQDWEHAWDTTNLSAGVEVAAISEAHSFLLGEQGLVAHLGVIDFDFAPEDAEVIIQALQANGEERDE